MSLPGGDLRIDWPGEGGVMMEGPIAQGLRGRLADGEVRQNDYAGHQARTQAPPTPTTWMHPAMSATSS